MRRSGDVKTLGMILARVGLFSNVKEKTYDNHTISGRGELLHPGVSYAHKPNTVLSVSSLWVHTMDRRGIGPLCMLQLNEWVKYGPHACFTIRIETMYFLDITSMFTSAVTIGLMGLGGYKISEWYKEGKLDPFLPNKLKLTPVYDHNIDGASISIKVDTLNVYCTDDTLKQILSDPPQSVRNLVEKAKVKKNVSPSTL